ncbi:fibroblast growth factor receptor 1-like, partial [Paramuricea clavata]
MVKEGLYTSSENSNPEVVAVKMLKDNARESDLSDLLAELEILKKINKAPHPNVIRFIGGCSLEGKLLVVTELCPGGNLQKFLRNNRVDYANITSTLNQRQLLKMAVEVASGMVHLSSQK